MLIIDSHCHYGKGEGFNGPWDTVADISSFMQWSRAAGISRTIIFAALGAVNKQANAAVARLVKRYPALFWGYVFIHPVQEAGQVNSIIQEAVNEYGFRGIKVHRHDGTITREICEAARAYNLPVLYDVMGMIEQVPLFAAAYPDVNFIIPHLGSFADDWKAHLNLVPILQRFPNVYADTSGVKRFDMLQMAYEQCGAGKLIFGTDGPWLHPRVELAKIYALNMPVHEQAQVLAGNIIRLTGKAGISSGSFAPGQFQL